LDKNSKDAQKKIDVSELHECSRREY
jgi:hypothetical protein